MDPGWQDANVYELVTQLVKHTLRRNYPENGNFYMPPRDDIKIVKRLRSKAFEILLNKSNKIYDQENKANCRADPLVQILKYAFVLKLSLKRISEATELENLINNLFNQEANIEPVVDPVLKLLIELKHFQIDTQPALDIFHYGKTNPLLPEDVTCTNGVPMFQTYPMESFVLPEKFEAMLGICRTYPKQNASANFVSRISFEDQHVSKAILGIETIRYNNAIEMAPCISNSSNNTPKQYNMISPLLMCFMQVDTEQTSKLYLSTPKFISNMTLPCEWIKPIENQKDNLNGLCSLDDSNCNFANEAKHVKDNIDLIWENMRLSDDCVSKLRTWESLGTAESPKQTLFVTDLPETTMHLARIRQTSILSLLPKKAMTAVQLMQEVSLKKFLSDIKTLLFGIDSDSFTYDNVTGFKLEENITVLGISSESLMITCREAINWGNSFKSLSRLVTPDPQTGKLQQDGLIFKAMCTNVKELLLYYRAALQRILNRHEFHGLLSLFKEVRPLARLIVEVARLCGYEQHGQCALVGGSGILTHIYKEVTKVTDPKVALVFYSILKSCCEVYFRFLQNWLFEGTFDDIYGEFMIQMRSQHLRKRGRKFWTEGFAVDTDSVPGFLSDLSESILRCGKTLRLLKICSPKNSVCNISISAQPEVRVCLSVSMLREQLLRCQEYERKGEATLGPIVSLLSAIRDEKKAEREKAELVIRAQQDTLARINKQREELVARTVQSKRVLLQMLKKQAEESALIKEKEKELEMLADKLLLEKINREQEEMREQQRAEREHLVSYYDKLAGDLERIRVRSNWRKARMNNFERRVKLLESLRRRDRTMSESTPNSGENVDVVDIDELNKDTPVSIGMDVSTCEVESVPNQDENSNFAGNEAIDVTTDIFNHISPAETLSPTEVISTDTDTPPTGNRDSNNKNNVSAEEVTTKYSHTTQNTQNVCLPQKSLPWNYIYKRNNERSNLQDFLRDEAMKEIRTIMTERAPNTMTLDVRLNNILRVDELTGKIIGVVNRPKSLAIEKIDNMTAAQANKLKVLLEEYGMTPNNNEFSTILAGQAQIADCTNLNDNNRVLLDAVHERDVESTGENVNNNVLSTFDVELPETTAIVGGLANNYECSHGADANEKAQELVFGNGAAQQNIMDTPMSCTTDNFTTLSTHTPLSQVPNCEDLFSLNVGPETSCLSSNTVRFVTEETCFESPMSDFKLPNLFGLSPDVVRPNIVPSSLTIADVEMIDHTSLKVYLEKSIIIPLQIQSRLINNAIIKYLLNEHNMLLHLHSLRSYFFLLNGEFAKSLTDSLYSRLYAISAPIELFNSATLTNLLEQALMNSFSNNYVNSELLSLSAVDKPRQLYISDPNVLECLCLNYKISWPLNIILDDTVMLQYSKVFKFLIMTGRMSWVLKEDFNIMKVDRNVVVSEQYHKLQLYRHSMTQFMNALHNYLTCSVLHASWSEFEKDLQNSRTIDQIYLSHMNYIKKILSRCMLNTRGEKMRVCLINIFKIILKFHNRLRSQIWTVGSTGRYSHPNFKSLEQMYQSFCEWRTYMAHVAHKLAISGYQPHLTHFLNALNMNHMYDLTTKQQ